MPEHMFCWNSDSRRKFYDKNVTQHDTEAEVSHPGGMAKEAGRRPAVAHKCLSPRGQDNECYGRHQVIPHHHAHIKTTIVCILTEIIIYYIYSYII